MPILAIQHNNETIADIAERFLTKGVKVYVEGQLRTRKWTDQGGQENYATEVVLPSFKGEMTMLSRANAGERPEANGVSGGGYLPRGGGSGSGPDDELPFAPQVLGNGRGAEGFVHLTPQASGSETVGH